MSKAIREVRAKIKSEELEEMKSYYKDVISELKKRAHCQIEIYEKDIQNMPERYKSDYLKDCNYLKANFEYIET
jgi:ribosomal protein S20